MEQTILELAKVSLQLYFMHMQLAGKSQEEMKAEFDRAKAEFDMRTPDKLK